MPFAIPLTIAALTLFIGAVVGFSSIDVFTKGIKKFVSICCIIFVAIVLWMILSYATLTTRDDGICAPTFITDNNGGMHPCIAYNGSVVDLSGPDKIKGNIPLDAKIRIVRDNMSLGINWMGTKYEIVKEK